MSILVPDWRQRLKVSVKGGCVQNTNLVYDNQGHVIPANLIPNMLWIRFQEQQGLVVHDSSGNRNVGLITLQGVGSVVHWTTGPNNCGALYLSNDKSGSGIFQWLSFPNSPSTDLPIGSNLTLNFWINPKNTFRNDGTQDSPTAKGGAWFVILDPSNANNDFSFFPGDTQWDPFYPAVGVWTMVTYVVNTNLGVFYYLNGAQTGGPAQGGPGGIGQDASEGVSIASSNHLGSEPFDATFADYRLDSRAWTPAMIHQAFSIGPQ